MTPTEASTIDLNDAALAATSANEFAPALPLPRSFFAISFSFAFLFVVWTWFVRPWTQTQPEFDLAVAEHWSGWSGAHPAMLDWMIYFTDLGGIAAMTLLAIMGLIWQTALGNRKLALAWLGITILGALINQGVKEYFGRPRPPEAMRETVVHERNASYPSGHTMASTIGYGLVGYALLLPMRRRTRRIFTVLVLTCLVLAIGFSRAYLRAHWLSDVVGGWMLGSAWLFLCIGRLEYRRRAV